MKEFGNSDLAPYTLSKFQCVALNCSGGHSGSQPFDSQTNCNGLVQAL